jgi:hypothetical protein
MKYSAVAATVVVAIMVTGCGGSGSRGGHAESSQLPPAGSLSTKRSVGQASNPQPPRKAHSAAGRSEAEREAKRLLVEEEQRAASASRRRAARRRTQARQASHESASYAGVQYAIEQQGWSEAEAASFVLIVGEAGIAPKQAEGVAAAALTLESQGWNHKNAVLGALETYAALGGGG